MTTISWLLLAAIHVLPGLAFVRPAMISQLYGVEPSSESFLLLQHRAALFLVVAAVCVWAALRPETRQLAVVVVGMSIISFLVLFGLGGSPTSLRLIAIVDAAALIPLGLVAWRAFAKV